ncbi:MAG: aspartate-semialdehyde dehydrogenase [Crenarchaeota archaeon]|nr:aspartate-semialdehyde dehydrogenase [Thermoproteota archaeon]
MSDKLRVAVLGATGIVGQRFVARLSKHPWFELEGVYASYDKAGLRYREAVKWVINEAPDESIMETRVEKIDIDLIARENYDLVFSALPSTIAENIEVELAKRGVKIVSNASPLRLEQDIPLINPEVNADHIKLLNAQKKRGWKGWIAKVPNCSTAILTLALKPLHQAYGISRVIVVTMQAVSGAGLKGVPSPLIIDNIIPYIKGEEEKIVQESRKILGLFNGRIVMPASFEVLAFTTRVPVIDGHMEAVFVELEETPRSEEDIIELLERYHDNKIETLRLPSAPKRPVVVREEVDRPQPRLDRMAGNGMSVTVGRLSVNGKMIKMIVLGHNTIRGAAGNGVLIGELAYKLNLI